MEKTLLANDEAKQFVIDGKQLECAKVERLAAAKKEFLGPVTIIDCNIDTLDLNRCIFHDTVTIRRCRIKSLLLNNAEFRKKCDFKRSKIGRLRAPGAKFLGGLKCDSTELHATFHRAEFHDRVEFGWSTFNGDVTLTDITIRGELDFRNTTVRGALLLRGATCDGRALLSDMNVEGIVNATESIWRGDIKLNNMQIGLDLNLFGSQLGGNTDLSNTTVGRMLSLANVQLGDLQEFRFTGLVAASYAMRRETVQGHIAPERSGHVRAAISEFSFLRTTFQTINRFEDEDWAYYQLKRMERRSLSWMNPIHAARRFGSWLFLDLSCGYGTKPFRALAACAAIIVMFAFLFFFSISENGSPHDYGLSQNLNNIVFALDTSITAFSGDYSNAGLQGAWRIAGMIEFLTGIVYLGLFVVAFSRKVIR